MFTTEQLNGIHAKVRQMESEARKAADDTRQRLVASYICITETCHRFYREQPDNMMGFLSRTA